MFRYGLPERRKIQRVYIRIPIICEIIDPKDKSTKHKTVMTSDINSEGIYFESDEVLILGTELKAVFQLPKSNYSIQATLYDSIKRYFDRGIIDEEMAAFYSQEFSRYSR